MSPTRLRDTLNDVLNNGGEAHIFPTGLIVFATPGGIAATVHKATAVEETSCRECGYWASEHAAVVEEDDESFACEFQPMTAADRWICTRCFQRQAEHNWGLTVACASFTRTSNRPPTGTTTDPCRPAAPRPASAGRSAVPGAKSGLRSLPVAARPGPPAEPVLLRPGCEPSTVVGETAATAQARAFLEVIVGVTQHADCRVSTASVVCNQWECTMPAWNRPG